MWGMNVAVRSTARMMIINGNGLKVNSIMKDSYIPGIG